MSRLQLSARCALVAMFAALFAGGAWLGANRLAAARGVQHLDELAETVLRYAETAVDSAEALLAETARAGPTDCGDASLQAIRLRVYQNGVIKDLRVATRDGAVRCSAYAETLEFDRAWPGRDEMLEVARPAGSGDLRLFRVEQFTSDALGVFRDGAARAGATAEPGGALVAIVGIDPRQLDVLSGPLHEAGRVSLGLADGPPIVAYAPPGHRAGAETTHHDAAHHDVAAHEDTVLVARDSRRYPLRAEIRVARPALAAREVVPVAPLLAGAGGLGALFGFLVARLLARPADAADALDRAIAAREFRPYYQPIFRFEDRAVLGCEVLMRWVRADGRVVGPGAFIPLAESTGRIAAMTWGMLEIALAELRPATEADPAFKVSVNVVPRHLLSAGFAERLGGIVARSGVGAGHVVLEITERDELEDFERAGAVIAGLRASGFRIAVDDVGIGHSGLSYIQRLRPDMLKIDKFFVDSIGRDGTADAVVAMLVRLAGELGMGVVAEGIETEAQAVALRACGVTEGQGYLVSPPVPGAAFLAMLVPPAGDLPAAA